MNKQRVTLHFSLRLGNLASNYRICLTVLNGLRRLGSASVLRSVSRGDIGRVEAGRQGQASAAKGEMIDKVNLSQRLEGINFP